MRLERIDVQAFGRVRDRSVELAPALTVLLGPNEAGKSTLLRAVRAALYGVDAGGQGRALARSDWSRWRPWEDAQRYGLTLTYTLADGRRFRVARRLDSQREEAQVVELGGREVTDSLRQGRALVPGWFHLGIDEAVFCATACVGEDSLRADAPDAAWARADRLQEAIERLADSASRATAAEALGRLRHAMDRVGTENRGRSPLGAATTRLRELDLQLARARERMEALGGEQERLRDLEATAMEAAERRGAAERAWLVGRLAALAAQRAELSSAQAEAERLVTACQEWAVFADFPVDREDRVVAIAGSLRQAGEAVEEAAARWSAGRDRLRLVERRRREIATSLRALGGAPRVTDADREEFRELGEEVAAEAAVARQAAELRTSEARLAALRTEVAATGLGPIPVGSAAAAGELIEAALGTPAQRRLRPMAVAVALIGGIAAAALLLAGLRQMALVAAGVALLVGLALLLTERVGEGPGDAARRRLGRLCAGLDTSDEGLRRCARRLPELASLHDDLRRQELLIETQKAQLGAAVDRLAELSRRCQVLAARLPVEVELGPTAGMVGAGAELARARAALAAVAQAADAGRRRVELEAEDATLDRESMALRAVGDAAESALQRREELSRELASHLATAGLESDGDWTAAIAAFRQGCATRRQLEEARTRLVEVRRRITALGPADDASLSAQEVQLEGELVRRGGDPAALAVELPLDPGGLHALEVTADRARQESGVAAAQAAALRSRLAGLLDGLPPIADLEDERAACVAVRDRALRQLEALRRASACIEEAARRVHRNVAPRLAGGVGSRLALLTEGRYSEVNVDAERFAVTLRTPERPDLVPLDALSRGTRDQVALLLRLTLAEILGEAGEPVPLLLDDPLLSSDPLRRAGALDFLLNLARQGNQVVITTSDPAVAEHVMAAGVEGCAVVEVGRRSALRLASTA